MQKEVLKNKLFENLKRRRIIMRQIKAFIRRNMSDEAIAALRNAGFLSVSISEIEGTGMFTSTADVQVFNLPAIYNKMTKLEIVCREEDVKNIVEVIHKYAATGEKGDGVIYVSHVLQVFKVRTGKQNSEENL
jgi:nitrogen regulatory protein P-II 1